MKYRVLALLLALTLLCGCSTGTGTPQTTDDQTISETPDNTAEASSGESTEETTEVTTEAVTEEVTEAPVQVEVLFERFFDAGQEYATLTGVDNSGAIVWQYTTDAYDAAQLNRTSNIGSWEDRHYFVEDGSVVALDIQTGDVLWKNADFGGSPAGEEACLITKDGTAFVTGYFGPDVIIIDANGNTKWFVDQFSPDLFWPYQVEIAEGQLVIYYESGPNQEKSTLAVDLP